MGCHWTTASVLARSALQRPRLLFPRRRRCTAFPVDFAQEVQGRVPQVPQLPAHLHQHGQHASRDAAQLRALGARLLCVQLCHPPAILWLVVQVQL